MQLVSFTVNFPVCIHVIDLNHVRCHCCDKPRGLVNTRTELVTSRLPLSVIINHVYSNFIIVIAQE